MSIIIDLIIVAIIGLTAVLSARRGFVRAAIEVVGFAAAIFLAFTLSSPLANITYDRVVEPSVMSSVEELSSGTTEEVIDATWNSLPKIIIKNAEGFGISKEMFSEKIVSGTHNGATVAATTASQAVIKPIFTKFASLLYSVFMLVILMFVVNLLARIANKLFSFSIVGKLNRTLGGVVGIIKGIIIAMVFCMIISLIVSFTQNGFLLFTTQNINDTILFKTIASFSPFNI